MSNSYVSVSNADDAILKNAGINANGMELNRGVFNLYCKR